MPLNASEKNQIAQSFLRCFGEDSFWCGRTLRFVSLYTNNNVNLLAEAAALAALPALRSVLSMQ